MGGAPWGARLRQLTHYVIWILPEGSLSLFMLVSALMGLDIMHAAYAHAIAGSCRFYSYGDGGLLLPQPAK